jgi:intraflagellar transport protein 81
MREAQHQDGETNAEAMLKVLRNEVHKGRDALMRVRRETEDKLDRLREIDSALSETAQVSKSDLDNLEMEINGMQNKVQDLEQKIEEHNQDPRLAVYRQQANLVAKKKEERLKEKRQIEEERDGLSKDLSTKEREYEQMKGHKFMKRDEFKKYAESLREKSGKFKRLKTELSELRHEVAVLLRTEQLLQAKDPTPVGLRETEAKLEKASVEKSSVDKAKGKTLDEISAIVQKINQQLKEKKNKLAPQIKALRSVRQNFQQVEVKYLEKKGAWDQAKSQVDGDLSKVAGEVKQLESDVLEAEQCYHDLNMQLSLYESKLQRAHRESRCIRKEEKHSQQFATLSDQYLSEIKRLDEQCVELRRDQKVVKDTHEEKLKQKKAFMQLEKLLTVKLKVARQEQQNLVDGKYGGMTTGAVMEERTAGVERLVMIDGAGWDGA